MYIDDIVLAGKDEARIQEVKQMPARKFNKKSWKANLFSRNVSGPGPVSTHYLDWIGQPAYTKKLLGKQKMDDCKPVGTPVSPGSHLVKATDDEEAVEQKTVQVSCVEPNVPLCTRPDLTYAVGILARFSSKPNRSHWTAAKRT